MPWGEQQLREDIVGAGRMMYERGWIAANDGNLTVRLDSERIHHLQTCRYDTGRNDAADRIRGRIEARKARKYQAFRCGIRQQPHRDFRDHAYGSL